ncbi:MAG: lyase family protein, partial [Nocardioides sp.]|nr:lyase family protein [Nocardioides sp.]
MADLFWPGDERAAEVFSSAAFLDAMVRTEGAWLAALVAAGVAPAAAGTDLTGLVGADDIAGISAAAESGGNPAMPLLRLLRDRAATSATREWLHRGLTSQDVVDCALMACAREAITRVSREVDQQVTALVQLVEEHRDTVMAGRTLTQHAVPITFGLKAALWLGGLLDAREQLRGVRTPAQLGGAAGTLAATVELARRSGADDPVGTALAVVAGTTTALGLDESRPWHTSRAPVARLGDALVGACDVWGRIANDVLVLSRPEIGELAEPAGRGGSSTMPHKANPVLAVLVRRASLTAPMLGAQLHLASTEAVDERPDGSWHTEWTAVAALSRRTLVAASQMTELVTGLHVDSGRMAATAAAATSSLLAEPRSVVPDAATDDLSDYLGATDEL